MIVVMVCSLFVRPVAVEGTAGKLRSASICRNASGVTYGQHGNGHWHRAKKYKTGWYPQGKNLGKANPCRKR